jgi:hypothetical protein
MSCSYLNSLRSGDGWFSAINNKFVLLKMLGYKVDPDYMRQARSSDIILHVNEKIYPWEKIELEAKNSLWQNN